MATLKRARPGTGLKLTLSSTGARLTFASLSSPTTWSLTSTVRRTGSLARVLPALSSWARMRMVQAPSQGTVKPPLSSP